MLHSHNGFQFSQRLLKIGAAVFFIIRKLRLLEVKGIVQGYIEVLSDSWILRQARLPLGAPPLPPPTLFFTYASTL